MIYLAIPYSHPVKAVQDLRFEIANRAAAYFFDKGITVFSPISHSHLISEYTKQTEYKLWLKMDFEILRNCQALYILLLDGWQASKGVKMEVEYAFDNGIPIFYFEPDYDSENGKLKNFYLTECPNFSTDFGRFFS